MNEKTWRRYTAVPLMVASVVFLVAYSWRVITDASGPIAVFADILVVIAWAMFIIDYLVRLSIAPKKWLWFRTHLADLVVTLIPVLRLVRLLRVFTELPGVRRTRAGVIRNRLTVYSLGSVVILIYIASLQVLDVERNAPGATIVSFGDALWWACVTATTTGYGDYTPVTVPGRTVGVMLMFGGVALTGVITAILASWVMDRAQQRGEHRIEGKPGPGGQHESDGQPGQPDSPGAGTSGPQGGATD